VIHFISDLSVLYLSWYNAGGFGVDTRQIAEYLNSRMEVWAYSKVK